MFAHEDEKTSLWLKWIITPLLLGKLLNYSLFFAWGKKNHTTFITNY